MHPFVIICAICTVAFVVCLGELAFIYHKGIDGFLKLKQKTNPDYSYPELSYQIITLGLMTIMTLAGAVATFILYVGLVKI